MIWKYPVFLFSCFSFPSLNPFLMSFAVMEAFNRGNKLLFHVDSKNIEQEAAKQDKCKINAEKIFLSHDLLGVVGLHLHRLCLCFPPLLRHDPLQRPDDHSGDTLVFAFMTV